MAKIVGSTTETVDFVGLDTYNSQDEQKPTYLRINNDPTNIVVPRFDGDICVDPTAGTIYVAQTGGDAGTWIQV